MEKLVIWKIYLKLKYQVKPLLKTQEKTFNRVNETDDYSGVNLELKVPKKFD